MNNDPREWILPDVRIRVWHRYNNAMQSATVVARYGYRSDFNPAWIYPDLVSVIFDGESRISAGHFTSGVEKI